MFETTSASIVGGTLPATAFPAGSGRIPLHDVDEFGPIAGAAPDGAALGGGAPLAIEEPWLFGDQSYAALRYVPRELPLAPLRLR